MRNKIQDINSLQTIVQTLKQGGKTLVFTNGCFDLIHVGHIRYLYRARSFGDILIVAVNSDSSVRQLKGENRPIINERERAELLSALEMVDYVFIFDELTCSNVIKEIKPDVYVKGGDYTLETLPEWPVVKELGSRVELVKEVKGKSTTEIINKIKSHT
ncbi:D-glycero-beta-D-manno-heptose 1-phosphate adenylyltransferase [Halothermothrix orenii]|uniref:D-glycero-beta-D-manno-heptose 1-phosphate adenylyltransferase n=1 Tax=Halothermothrix orenii (strain H 168 / OCM 544 / DSM 9562) TaxID=373903 RepID=B8CYN0_HALOH|nr:D-glycero-beta-D-manno-heptose 1-phosphate adenylyltransferase [Halothermothrix orenii]ACL70399.1 RfaeE domain II [Halothermothrix orenii H 168]